jgi:hypothetical protein
MQLNAADYWYCYFAEYVLPVLLEGTGEITSVTYSLHVNLT